MPYVPIMEQVEKLPPLPESVQKLESLFAQHEHPDINEVVAIIESDPALTTNILASANSPLYSFSKQISSILQATTLFGAATIRAMALKSAMEQRFTIDMSPYGIDNRTFADICTIQSTFIFQWYMGIDVEKAKLLVPMAFLMETGAILIAKNIIEHKDKKAFLEDLTTHKEIRVAENLHVNMSTAQVNALLFEHWNFEDIFIECMRTLDGENTPSFIVEKLSIALRAVRLAVNLKEQFSERSIAKAQRFLESHHLNSDKFLNVAERMQKKFALL